MFNDVTDEARRRFLERSAKGWPLPLMGARREAAQQKVVAMRERKAA